MGAKELREFILSAHRAGGRLGRHILGMNHTMQHTMAEENIRAILEAVREIQAGMHDG